MRVGYSCSFQTFKYTSIPSFSLWNISIKFEYQWYHWWIKNIYWVFFYLVRWNLVGENENYMRKPFSVPSSSVRLQPILFVINTSQEKAFYTIVMGSIEENRYRYRIDSLAKVSILRYPSENPHHELHIHKLVTYFDFRTLNLLGFFNICTASISWLFPF